MELLWFPSENENIRSWKKTFIRVVQTGKLIKLR